MSLSWPTEMQITSTVFSDLQIRRDTRISRWEASPCVESTSCGQLASLTVEDEPNDPRRARVGPTTAPAGTKASLPRSTQRSASHQNQYPRCPASIAARSPDGPPSPRRTHIVGSDDRAPIVPRISILSYRKSSLYIDLPVRRPLVLGRQIPLGFSPRTVGFLQIPLVYLRWANRPLPQRSTRWQRLHDRAED